MKTTIYALITAIAILFVGSFAFADEMPEYMRDGVINVTLKNGRTYTFSLNEYKVVRRGSGAEVAPDAGDEVPAQRVVYLPAPQAEEHPNRLTLHGGGGYNGLDVVKLPGLVQVSQAQAFVWGATYARKLNDRFSVSGTWLSNSITLGVGYDF